MILYDSKTAPNPRRVRIFVAEKGLDIPRKNVDITNMENRRPPFIDKNPMAGVPVLELDDGTWLAESMAIARYLEARFPEPPLMGLDPKDQGLVEMWNRRMEFEILLPIAQVFRNTHKFFEGRVNQVPEYGRTRKQVALEGIAFLDRELAGREYVAGDRFSLADITALCAIDFGPVADVRVSPDQRNVKRWYDTVSARPSAAA